MYVCMYVCYKCNDSSDLKEKYLHIERFSTIEICKYKTTLLIIPVHSKIESLHITK